MFESGFRDESRHNRKTSSEGRWFVLLRSVWPQVHERRGWEKRHFSLVYGDDVWDEDMVPGIPCPLFSHFPWRLRAVNEFSDIPSDHRASLNLRAYKRHRFAFGFLIPPSWHWLYNSARLPRQRHVPPFLIGMYFSDPQLSDSKSFFFFPFFFGSFSLHETVKGRRSER